MYTHLLGSCVWVTWPCHYNQTFIGPLWYIWYPVYSADKRELLSNQQVMMAGLVTRIGGVPAREAERSYDQYRVIRWINIEYRVIRLFNIEYKVIRWIFLFLYWSKPIDQYLESIGQEVKIFANSFQSSIINKSWYKSKHAFTLQGGGKQ